MLAYYFSLGAWGIFICVRHEFKNLHSTCYNENLIMIFIYLFSFLTLFLGLSVGYLYISILPIYKHLPWYNFWPLLQSNLTTFIPNWYWTHQVISASTLSSNVKVKIMIVMTGNNFKKQNSKIWVSEQPSTILIIIIINRDQQLEPAIVTDHSGVWMN